MRALRNFRFLIVVMAIAGIAMFLEITDSTPIEEKEFLHPYIMSELYPERGESQMYQGIHAFLIDQDLPRARQLFEQAIATGLKTEEDLFYRYAEVLILLQAPESEVERAIALWKQHFPFSDLPDPREAADAAQKAAMELSRKDSGADSN